MKTLVLSLLLGVASLTSFADLEAMKARVPKVVELKEKGLIGEQLDGYLGVVKAEGEAQQVVDSENNDRKEEYAKRAQSKGQSTETLASVLGAARVRDEKPGRYVRSASGEWTKK